MIFLRKKLCPLYDVVNQDVLYEINWFSYNCDVVLWMFIGLMVNNYYKNEKLLERRMLNEKIIIYYYTNKK